MRYRSTARLTIVVTLLLTLGCASLAPTADPIVVRAEQALKGGDVAYKAAMSWYFAPGNAATLSPGVLKVFEEVRTGYDGIYKAADMALDVYKASKTDANKTALATSLINLETITSKATAVNVLTGAK